MQTVEAKDAAEDILAYRHLSLEHLKRLQRENVELKRAKEILRKASALFAQAEHDRRAK